MIFDWSKGKGLKALGQYISGIRLLNLNTAVTEQVNGTSTTDRILVSDAATRIYVRKKILAPLMLEPVPSLLRTSLRHCR